MFRPNALLTGRDNLISDRPYLLDSLKKMVEIRVLEQQVMYLSQTCLPKFWVRSPVRRSRGSGRRYGRGTRR